MSQGAQARTLRALAAGLAFVAVAAGAFGAHGLTDPRAKELIELGAHYQLMHALAVFVGGASPWSQRLFLIGAVLFGGSLEALALGAPRWAGAITPLGGLCLLAGWAWLACVLSKRQRADETTSAR